MGIRSIVMSAKATRLKDTLIAIYHDLDEAISAVAA